MSTAALAEAIARYTDAQSGPSPYVTAVPGLTLVRADRPTEPMPRLQKPSLCIVAQGAKGGSVGKTRVEYRAGQALVVGVEMPGVGRVSEASVLAPFLGAVVEFDPVVLREVLEGFGDPIAPSRGVSGAFVADFGDDVAACMLRLIALLERPHAIPALVPAMMRELSYWLLAGPSGGTVASVVFGVDRSERVIAAIRMLRERFRETIPTRELAETAGMSTSAFNRTFKSMTSLTPLQYQKHVRLHEARNLMLASAANAETAAYRVGYESASHFSREYARMFGAPPHRDTESAKAALGKRRAVSAP
jgi:AraC-like DNA-binding protein